MADGPEIHPNDPIAEGGHAGAAVNGEAQGALRQNDAVARAV